jgi:surfactin synthase thioesterase subunit
MSWFRCPEPRPFATLRLVCFPHAGGSAVFFRPWAKAVSPAVEVHAVQYPGRADRLGDPLIRDVGRMSTLIAAAIAPLLDRPVAFFGHSMGATVAYETARVLEARGIAPVHLFASAASAPHARTPRVVSAMNEEELVAEMLQLGGTDSEVLEDPEMRALILPYVRNDFESLEFYRHKPGPPLDIPITALAGDADPDVTPAHIERWVDVTSALFKSLVLPGGHFYLVPQQQAVLSEVGTTLNVPTL